MFRKYAALAAIFLGACDGMAQMEAAHDGPSTASSDAGTSEALSERATMHAPARAHAGQTHRADDGRIQDGAQLIGEASEVRLPDPKTPLTLEREVIEIPINTNGNSPTPEETIEPDPCAAFAPYVGSWDDVVYFDAIPVSTEDGPECWPEIWGDPTLLEGSFGAVGNFPITVAFGEPLYWEGKTYIEDGALTQRKIDSLTGAVLEEVSWLTHSSHGDAAERCETDDTWPLCEFVTPAEPAAS